MKNCLILLFLILLSCCSKNKTEKSEGIFACDDKWVFEQSNVDQKNINDSVAQQIVDGKLWFEIISPKAIGNGLTKAFIKNYRMDGSLESEGFAHYYEHPIKDYQEVGLWKFYDCKGNSLKTILYKER